MQTATATRPAAGNAPQQAPNGQGRALAAAASTVVPAPTRAQFKPLAKCDSVDEALKHPEMMDRIRAALPRHLSPERMLRVMALAVYKTPDLRKCELMSLLGAMLVCASLGLEPNTPLGHAYLIPFKNRKKGPEGWYDVHDVQLVIGYRGFVDLARRSGHVIALHSDIVYEGDEFSFEYGTEQHLRHIPTGSREGRQPVWAYCHAKLTDGEAFEVLPYAEVLRIRNQSQGYQQALRVKAERGPDAGGYAKNPWVAFEHEMASKTMVRRLAKMLPLTIEFANAASLDTMSDAGGADLARIAAATDVAQAIDVGDYEVVGGNVAEIEQAGVDDNPPPPAEAPRQQRGTRAARKPEPQALDPQPQPQQVSEERPAADAPAFILITCDGEPLEWGDPADGQDVFREFTTELNEAVKRGPQTQAGFVESNAALIDVLKARGFAMPPTVTAVMPKAADPMDIPAHLDRRPKPGAPGPGESF